MAISKLEKLKELIKDSINQGFKKIKNYVLPITIGTAIAAPLAVHAIDNYISSTTNFINS